LFAAAPFKHAFFLKMIERFSSDIESLVLVPSYPRTRIARTQGAALRDAVGVFFGDGETRKALAKFKPDTVYTNSPLYASQLKLSQIVAKQRIPIIVHLRGDIWREFFEWDGLPRFGTVIAKLREVNFYVTTGEAVKQSYFTLVKKSLGQLLLISLCAITEGIRGNYVE
jgi:hypothetical protein